MAIHQIPVLLLTGYLGSGKTTLVNRILSNSHGIRFAVIVNDIGEVNIDASLIQKGGVVGSKDDSLVALQNGCICCTLKMDLIEQLCSLAKMHCFDYIVIEASGICEPVPIAQTICSIPNLDEEYWKDGLPYLDNIVAVVDALRMKDEFGYGEALEREDIEEDDLENLLIQQLEFCNVVLLNKAAELTPDELGRVKAIVRAIQRDASIVECNWADVAIQQIIHTGAFDFDQACLSAAWLRELDNDIDEDEDDDDHEHEHHHEHEHGHHHHHGEGEALEYGIDTFVYYRRRPFDLNRFDRFVAKSWPKSIIRAKGLCWIAQQDDMSFLFEQAGRQKTVREIGQWYATAPADELEDMMIADPSILRDWDDEVGDRMNRIVFIGRNMDKDAIVAALDDCLA